MDWIFITGIVTVILVTVIGLVESLILTYFRQDLNEKLEDVTRIEVIGDEREYVKYDTKIKDIQLQDNNKTLKIFLK